jgi:hypothetical protein
MDERLERNDSVVSWMIAGGARFDPPDTRYLQHLFALRDANRAAGRSFSPFAWLTARMAPKVTAAGSPAGAVSASLSVSSTGCCAPA